MNALALALVAGLAATPTMPPAAPTPVAVTTVRIAAFAFAPRTVTIVAGTTVRFVNQDEDAHTVTAVDRSFDSGGLDAGQAWSRRFDTPGTYPYLCAIHPYMRATIVVRAK